MSENIGWSRRLSVAADAKGVIGHAGAVLLRKCADQTGLTGALSGALRVPGRSPGWDRGVVLVQLAVAIVLGATSMADIELLKQQTPVDPRFNSDSDQAILRIIAAAESVANASEATQVGILISESVRQDRLTNFFEDSSHGNHFSRKGPIAGVDPINLQNSQKDISAQVAERVYRIRNRIVHAKDDPKYSDVRVLLPKSKEAYELDPDIALARLLALEVIIDSQI